MDNTKCQISSHDQRKISIMCFHTQCQGRRFCCQMCLNESHKDHFDQLVDIDYLLNFIRIQSQQPNIPSPQTNQALSELNNVQKYITKLSQMIQIEVERLSSYSLPTICKNIGNQYGILQNDVFGMNQQKLDSLSSDMLKYFEVKNSKITEKPSLVNQSGSAYCQFMKQFSEAMTKIVKEFQLIKQISGQNENNNELINFTEDSITHSDALGICVLDICKHRSLIASGYKDKTVRLWSFENNSLIKTYSYSGPVQDVVFSNQGNLLAFGGKGNNSIKLIDISDINNDDIVSELYGHQKEIYRLIFSNNSKYLISGSEDRTIRVWDLTTKKEAFKFQSEASVQGVAITGDDLSLASNSWDGKIRIWNIQNQQIQCVHPAHSHGAGIQFSNDQKIIVSSDYDGNIKLWSQIELSQGRLLLIRQFKSASNCIWTVLLSTCSKFIISICNTDHEIKVMDSQTGQIVKSFKSKHKRNDYYNLDGFIKIVGVAITKNLDMIAYGQDGQIVIWKKA